MAIESDGKVRIELTRVEAISLLGLVWNQLKASQDPAALDWNLVRLLGILRKAIRRELPVSPADHRGGAAKPAAPGAQK